MRRRTHPPLAWSSSSAFYNLIGSLTANLYDSRNQPADDLPKEDSGLSRFEVVRKIPTSQYCYRINSILLVDWKSLVFNW